MTVDDRDKKRTPLVLRNDIYQANPLMQSRKVFDTMGMRIFSLGLQGLNPHLSLKDMLYDDNFPELFVPTTKLVKLFGGNTAYLHDLKAECKKLFDTIIELNRADGGFVLMHLFKRLEYKPDEGLYLQFDELMRPYLLDLFESKGYTKISVEQVFHLTSPYAWRLTEMMLQYQNITTFRIQQKIVREVNLEDLKFMLNVKETAYGGRMDNFRKFVLDAPIAEINAKTIYKMSYQTVKKGRTVTSFKFQMLIEAIPRNEQPEYANTAIKHLCELGFSLSAANEIQKACDDEFDCLNRIRTAQKILQNQKKRDKTPILNELGFLRKAIIENWISDGQPRRSKSRVVANQPANSAHEVSNTSRKRKALKEPVKKITKKTDIRELSANTRDLLLEMLESPNSEKFVEPMLLSAGWTLQEFKERYSKRRNDANI